MENNKIVLTAENSMWNMELVREAALKGDIKLYIEDQEVAYELGLVTKDGVVVGVR